MTNEKVIRTFSVIYRTGGTLNFKWNRVGERYPTKEAAYAKCQDLERMGYKSHYHDTQLLDAIGLPDTYE